MQNDLLKKKRIAIIQPCIGVCSRGGETFFMEMTKYLSAFYDLDIYSMGEDDSVKQFITPIDYHMSRILSCYNRVYNNSAKLKWILNATRYIVFLQPNAFFNRKFSKIVFSQYIDNKKYDLIYPGNGVGGVSRACKYRDKHGVSVIYSGGGGVGPGEWEVLRKKPDWYICISSSQLKWAKQYHTNVCMIPNGIYVERFKKCITLDKFRLRKNHKLIISVGHLDTDFKRHQLTIAALEKLREVDLIILGSGDAESELIKLADEKLKGRFVIKSVNYLETPEYYKSADLFVLPSKDEPFGIAYIEAMASGLPVVAPDDETRREIIGDAGLFCNVENIDEYANTIKEALDTKWGDKPIKRAQKYDYSFVGEQYHQLIEELIQMHPYRD